MLPVSIDHDIQFLINFYGELNDDNHLQTYLLNLKRSLRRLDSNRYFVDRNYLNNIITKMTSLVVVLKNLTSSSEEIEQAMAEIVEAANPPGKHIKKEILEYITLFVIGVMLGALLGFLLGTVVASLLSGILALASIYAVTALMTDVLWAGTIIGAVVTGVSLFEVALKNVEQLILRLQVQHITQAVFGTKEPFGVTFFFHKKNELHLEEKPLQKGLMFK